MRKLLLGFAAFLAVLIPATPAWAHAQLVGSDPAGDTTLAKAPAAVSLEFSELLNPDFTTIVVSDAARRRIPTSPPASESATGRISLDQPLGNGTYTVAYRVVSVDGHTVQGAYAFTVADPALPAVSAVAAPVADSGGIPASVLIGLGVVLVGLAAGYLLIARR